MNSLRYTTLFLAVLGGAKAVHADDATSGEGVSYFRDVWPIFRAKCQGCHQPAKPGGKFVLTSHELLMAGSRGDPVVVPGKPDESSLLDEITPDGDDPPAMPKDAAPLSETEVATIRQWIAAGAKDDTPASAKVRFDADHPPVYENAPVLTAVDCSPDGTLIAASGYHEVLLHKADGTGLAGRLVGLSERIESLQFSPDGKKLAVTGGSPSQMGEVQIWDVEKQKLLVGHATTFDSVYGASWSNDGKLVAFGCADNSVRAIDATSGNQVLFQGAHNDWVLGTAFSVDASHLVSVSRDRSMKLIKVDTEQFIDNITSITPGALKGGLIAVDCHPKEDRLLVGGADGTPKIYRMHREKARKIGDDFNLIRAFGAMPGRLYSVEFNADGSRFIAGSSFNGRGEIRSYQTADGKQDWATKLETAVYSVAYSHDYGRVAVGGYDGMIRILDAKSGEEVQRWAAAPVQRTRREF